MRWFIGSVINAIICGELISVSTFVSLNAQGGVASHPFAYYLNVGGFTMSGKGSCQFVLFSFREVLCCKDAHIKKQKSWIIPRFQLSYHSREPISFWAHAETLSWSHHNNNSHLQWTLSLLWTMRKLRTSFGFVGKDYSRCTLASLRIPTPSRRGLNRRTDDDSLELLVKSIILYRRWIRT